jgi:transcriptional regulator with XRE-family HTH domain
MGLEVNKRITECREKAKLSKKEVAERLGMKYTTYCRMEKEAKRITVQEAERIAEVLGADADYILYGRQNYDFTPLEQRILTVESPDRGKSPFAPPTPPIVKYTPDEFICSSEEKALVTIFRSLNLDEKNEVRDFLDKLKR